MTVARSELRFCGSQWEGAPCPFSGARAPGSGLGLWTTVQRGSDRFAKGCWYFAWSEHLANIFQSLEKAAQDLDVVLCFYWSCSFFVNNPDCLHERTAGRIVASILIAAAFVRKQVAPNLPFPPGTIKFRGQ